MGRCGPDGKASRVTTSMTRVHHGGPERALLMYSADLTTPPLEGRMGAQGRGAGAFGENLTVSGLNEDTACIGDIFRVGGRANRSLLASALRA
jgi:MOSC domain-containing protein YiiM